MNNEKLIEAENELRLAIAYSEHWRIASAVKLLYEAAKEDAVKEILSRLTTPGR